MEQKLRMLKNIYARNYEVSYFLFKKPSVNLKVQQIKSQNFCEWNFHEFNILIKFYRQHPLPQIHNLFRIVFFDRVFIALKLQWLI